MKSANCTSGKKKDSYPESLSNSKIKHIRSVAELTTRVNDKNRQLSKETMQKASRPFKKVVNAVRR